MGARVPHLLAFLDRPCACGGALKKGLVGRAAAPGHGLVAAMAALLASCRLSRAASSSWSWWRATNAQDVVSSPLLLFVDDSEVGEQGGRRPFILVVNGDGDNIYISLQRKGINGDGDKFN